MSQWNCLVLKIEKKRFHLLLEYTAAHIPPERSIVYYFRSGKWNRHSVGKSRTFRTYLQCSPCKYALMASSPCFFNSSSGTKFCPGLNTYFYCLIHWCQDLAVILYQDHLPMELFCDGNECSQWSGTDPVIHEKVLMEDSSFLQIQIFHNEKKHYMWKKKEGAVLVIGICDIIGRKKMCLVEKQQ